MKILFVCKHNIFRSKVAEAYFKKINKNKNIIASSAGIIPGIGLTKSENRTIKIQGNTAKKFGISFRKNPKGLSTGLLRKQDLIILVANDVPIQIFNNKNYVKKIILWKIQDVINNDPKSMENTISAIIQKVNKLNSELN